MTCSSWSKRSAAVLGLIATIAVLGPGCTEQKPPESQVSQKPGCVGLGCDKKECVGLGCDGQKCIGMGCDENKAKKD